MKRKSFSLPFVFLQIIPINTRRLTRIQDGLRLNHAPDIQRIIRKLEEK